MGTPWQIFLRQRKENRRHASFKDTYTFLASNYYRYLHFLGGLKAVQNSLFTQFFTTGLARELYCVVPFYAVKSASFPSQLADIALQVMSNMNVLCSCLCFCYIYIFCKIL